MQLISSRIRDWEILFGKLALMNKQESQVDCDLGNLHYSNNHSERMSSQFKT